LNTVLVKEKQNQKMVNNNINNNSDDNESSHLLLFVEEEQEQEEKSNDRNSDNYDVMRSLYSPALLVLLLLVMVVATSSSFMGTVLGSSNSIILSSSSSSSLSIVNDNDNDKSSRTQSVCYGKTNTVTGGLLTCPFTNDDFTMYGRGYPNEICKQKNCEDRGGKYDNSVFICDTHPNSGSTGCTTTLKCCDVPFNVPVPVPSSADKKSFHINLCGDLLAPDGRYIDVQDAIREANFNRFNNKAQIAYRVRGFQNGDYSTRHGKNTLVAYSYLWGGSCQGRCVARGGTPTCTY